MICITNRHPAEVPMHRHLPPPTTSDAARTATVEPDVLLIKRCAGCATLLAPTTVTCACCHGTEMGAVPSSGIGSIVSWKVASAPPDEPQACPLPSAIAIVRLDDGPQIYAWIEGEVPVLSDPPVRVRFRSALQGERSPVFAVSSTAITAPTAPSTMGAI
ncbi:Zn-ribbon domain-containing OB-fold protein [Rhodococcus sp. NPDC058514]|uniref:Zn-ribbon domain-containing OB-fold protein n=1 Tax=unclassified Rhodococcus (in: high G+C Gram-positive bacteria) TaxID=192944 RepID=UPI0036537442